LLERTKPTHTKTTNNKQMFAHEIVVNCAFVLGFLVLPEILRVNRRPTRWAWLALMPLLRCKLPDQCTYANMLGNRNRNRGGRNQLSNSYYPRIPTGPTFAPSLLYALWFASRNKVLETGMDTIQYEHGA
jgi:hypothetical protein